MHIVRYLDGNVRYGALEKDGRILPLRGSPFESLETSGPATHLDKVRLLAPIEVASIIGVGLNYANHAKEANLPLPTVPMLFMKPLDSVIGPDAPIIYPRQGQNVHYEGELAVVIGKKARRISEQDALSCVLGYTCGNDVSERVIQSAEMKQGCLLVGKGFDTFNPIGPSIATDLDPGNLQLETRVNGEVKQKTNTNDLVFSVPKLISYLSESITLRPGDIIMTGTPFGVGPVMPGDVVEIDIAGIGVLRNPVVAET
jgi:2-keto-4-pentenoate hydratase/2-oxohepta-3-ene-1,7-dioic acid hydratase in catechol pathway